MLNQGKGNQKMRIFETYFIFLIVNVLCFAQALEIPLESRITEQRKSTCSLLVIKVSKTRPCASNNSTEVILPFEVI